MFAGVGERGSEVEIGDGGMGRGMERERWRDAVERWLRIRELFSVRRGKKISNSSIGFGVA